MKSSVENTGPLGRKLSVEIPAPVVTGAFDKVTKQIQKEAHIKGFRPGKAPVATIRSLYGSKLQQDVAQDLIQHHYVRALMEHKLEPIGYPEFEFSVPLDNQDFTFAAHFEVRPEVPLKMYEGLEVEKEALEVNEERIDKVINNIRESHAQWTDLLEVRPAQKGDQAILDFEGFVDGKPLDKGAGTDFPLELGSERFIAGFEDGLIGMTIGAEKTLNLKFPEEYQAAELSGKPVEFKVKLKGLKKKTLPEMTAEFLKAQAGVETLEELRSAIRKDISESEIRRIDGDLKNRILRLLVKLNPFEVPDSLVKEQKESLIKDMQQRMQQQGLNEAQYQDYVAKWDSDFQKTAKEMIQSGFIIDTIAQKHNLIATEEDLEQKFLEYAKQTGIDLEKIKQFYGRPEQSQKLSYMITEDKVMKHLLSSAKVKEVPATKLQDRTAEA